ncbi:1-(5-phosphoribosyl)-5-[(5-phosphoribosylamino)methylideneamino]imidazole-4-carboxamide isomerase [Chloroflexota bacterium]
MEVIPAIDLRGGRCVRLYQGDYDQETVFSEDPVGMALHWQSLGAPRLHLVDLDGAARGELCHLAIISDIAKKVRIPVQVGGGIRQLDSIKQLLAVGVGRVILGTAAVESPELVKEACSVFGEAIIAGIDARDGYVCTQGWKRKTDITATELALEMAVLGVKRFVYTDIARDGTLSQPNFEAIEDLASKTELPIIASGGVTSISHLQRLSRITVEGAIVGRALYTGDIRLEEALAAVQ